MATSVGSMNISTLLAARFTNIKDYGLNRIQPILEAELAAHNALTMEIVGDLCEHTTDRNRIYGAGLTGEMVEVDEYGRAPTQKPNVGDTVGFPLRMFQFSIGWTEKWFQNHTPADMAMAVLAAEKAHLRRIQRDVKRALLLSANYTFRDFLVDNVDVNVKRLVNADGAQIPEGPNGELFDGSVHSHYNAVAVLDNPSFVSNIDDVVEHGYGGGVRVAINRADETAVSALAGFKAYSDPRIVYRVTDTPGKTLDITRMDNRAIGLLGAAEVWVKPWMPPNYALAWDASSPDKPLAFRQRSATSLQGLRIAATLSAFPLVAQYMEAEFGLGAWNRTNGAVLFFNGAAYTDPTV